MIILTHRHDGGGIVDHGSQARLKAYAVISQEDADRLTVEKTRFPYLVKDSVISL